MTTCLPSIMTRNDLHRKVTINKYAPKTQTHAIHKTAPNQGFIWPFPMYKQKAFIERQPCAKYPFLLSCNQMISVADRADVPTVSSSIWKWDHQALAIQERQLSPLEVKVATGIVVVTRKSNSVRCSKKAIKSPSRTSHRKVNSNSE